MCDCDCVCDSDIKGRELTMLTRCVTGQFGGQLFSGHGANNCSKISRGYSVKVATDRGLVSNQLHSQIDIPFGFYGFYQRTSIIKDVTFLLIIFCCANLFCVCYINLY